MTGRSKPAVISRKSLFEASSEKATRRPRHVGSLLLYYCPSKTHSTLIKHEDKSAPSLGGNGETTGPHLPFSIELD